MAIEKRPIHMCACGSTRTRNGSSKWVCDAAGEACPGNGLPLTILNLSSERFRHQFQKRAHGDALAD